MKRRIIIILVILLAGALFFSSCQMESPAPASIEGTWIGSNQDGTSLQVTFANSTKSEDTENAKLRISIPELIIYTSGKYSYSDGYASIAFRNTLSSSNPEFYATMVYDPSGSFTMRMDSIEGSFTMTRVE